MSRHEGVSCDVCGKGNFRGKRYKCLVCYDYDLCAACYDGGATTNRHSLEHPVQCILTRSEYELYYGGEAVSFEHAMSYTCPYCGSMGFSESQLQDHVNVEHADSSIEVICPVCAALPHGDPNHLTEDFPAHLALEHRAGRDLDDPSIRHMRHMLHPGRWYVYMHI
ncbi:E3 ubiquitin-protein ligase KCMF1-like [Corticium candelabrum]|uniref:E3 ubiquitin-protein ligase KCMF1-like n=1 Tax=Corticium candelabrum TaxID=121492 RepID=UPI002E2603E7|nr:E3 ubiquitin-protein ligase KCMF1-like [Corticium candelabrum]